MNELEALLEKQIAPKDRGPYFTDVEVIRAASIDISDDGQVVLYLSSDGLEKGWIGVNIIQIPKRYWDYVGQSACTFRISKCAVSFAETLFSTCTSRARRRPELLSSGPSCRMYFSTALNTLSRPLYPVGAVTEGMILIKSIVKLYKIP